MHCRNARFPTLSPARVRRRIFTTATHKALTQFLQICPEEKVLGPTASTTWWMSLNSHPVPLVGFQLLETRQNLEAENIFQKQVKSQRNKNVGTAKMSPRVFPQTHLSPLFCSSQQALLYLGWDSDFLDKSSKLPFCSEISTSLYYQDKERVNHLVSFLSLVFGVY